MTGAVATAAGLRAELAAMLDEPVADDTDLLEAGLDSIRLMELVERLRAAGHEVSFVDLAECPTVGCWITLLRLP